MLVRLLAINFLVLLVGAVLFELFLGAWFGGNQFGALVAARDTTTVYNATGLYEGGREIVYTRDGFGLRGTYHNPSDIGIVTIGGSTTDQRYIDDDDTFQNILSKNFEAAGRAISVVNAGRDGQSTVGHLHAFDEWFPMIPGFRPKAVLLYIGINDRYLPDGGFGAYERFDEMTGPNRLWYYLQSRSAFYAPYRTVKGMADARAAGVGYRKSRLVTTDPAPGESLWQELVPPSDLQRWEDEFRPKLDAYELRVKKLIERITDSGAKPVIVTQAEASFHLREGKVFGLRQPNGTVSPGDYGSHHAQRGETDR